MRSRCAMWRSCSPSAVWRRITRSSGVGCNVTVPRWNSDGAGSSSRPTNPGASMRPIFASRAVGVSSIGPSIPRALPSTSCCRRCAMRLRPNVCSVRRSAIPRIRNSRVINTDKARLYCAAIAGVKEAGTLRRPCGHRPVQYLNNILEQDHRAIKRRVRAKQGSREFGAARRTIAGYEALHMIRKGQVRWVSDHDVRQQHRFIHRLFDLAA